VAGAEQQDVWQGNARHAININRRATHSDVLEAGRKARQRQRALNLGTLVCQLL
jgi:hypothetical protein